jgi:predicted HNH restriction endonuclease
MALPTGTISMSQVNTELGRSSTATISLNESAVRTLAGVASGTISMDNLRGKSNVSFSPDGGTSAGSPVTLSQFRVYPQNASVTISCTQSATWTWTRSGDTASASVASGGSATSITFTLSSAQFQQKLSTFTVSGTAGGITRHYTVTLETESLN